MQFVFFRHFLRSSCTETRRCVSVNVRVCSLWVCCVWSTTACVCVCKWKLTYCYYLLLRDHSEDIMSALKASLCKHSVSTLMYHTAFFFLPSPVSTLFLHLDLSIHLAALSLTFSCLHSVPKKGLFRLILNVEPLIINSYISALIK